MPKAVATITARTRDGREIETLVIMDAPDGAPDPAIEDTRAQEEPSPRDPAPEPAPAAKPKKGGRKKKVGGGGAGDDV